MPFYFEGQRLMLEVLLLNDENYLTDSPLNILPPYSLLMRVQNVLNG